MSPDTKRGILAFVLSAMVIFGWQYFFPSPEPMVQTSKVKATKVKMTDIASVKAMDKGAPIEPVDSLEVVTVELQNEITSFTLNNRLEVVSSKSINSSSSYPEHFEGINNSFRLVSNSEVVTPNFIFSKIDDAKYSISEKTIGVSGLVYLDPKGFLNITLSSSNEFGYLFSQTNEEISHDDGKSNQYFVYHKELENFSISDDEKLDLNVNWFGTDFSYYFFGTIFPSPSINRVEVNEAGKLSIISIKPAKSLDFKYIFTQKKYQTLLELGHKLDQSIEFGIWEIIAVPILRGLEFFYRFLGNYGFAIILLTIVIRTLTFPLQYKSFKSMKKMQVVQPELQKIKEKFKDNPQQMQKETMALFKREGANPIGGCLPLLLQMPIFFAFYKVLYSAVELVDAPFVLWITDLSQKDPYYVLPVLMSLAMFLNTKLTPATTADPTQQKLMMFMPLIFGFIMKDLPSGLTLYIFISTIVGMLQQLFVYKRVA